jgi:hypothetical protein
MIREHEEGSDICLFLGIIPALVWRDSRKCTRTFSLPISVAGVLEEIRNENFSSRRRVKALSDIWL